MSDKAEWDMAPALSGKEGEGPPEAAGAAEAEASAVEAAPPAAAPPTDVAKLHEELGELRQLIVATQERLAAIEETVGGTAKQVSLLPAQLRMLGGKIENLSTSISEPRYREVLLRLLGVYDLVDQVLRTLPAGSDASTDGDRHNYEVLRAQLRQILEANGLSEIPATGLFDPEVHRALQSVPVEDPAQANCVLDVVRPGFRTEQSILRYAEVRVGRYEAPKPAAE